MAITQNERRVLDAIQARSDALLNDLRAHVETPTGPNSGDGLARTRAVFRTRCERLGAVCEEISGDHAPAWVSAKGGEDVDKPATGSAPPTLVCRRLTGNVKAVLLSGHLDTVHDALGAFRKLTVAPDGKTAVGPGCVDMKGGLVIAIHALEAMHETGTPLEWSWILNSDEETGSFSSGRALHAEAASGRYAAGLALEPAMADGGLAIARGGSGQFMLEARGKAAHVGRDFASGVSAVDGLCRAITAAHAHSRPGEGLCVNVSPLWCDAPTNVVSDHARAWGNVRFPSPQAGDQLAAAIDGLTNSGEMKPGGAASIRVRRAYNRPAKPLTPATQALADAARAASEDLGRPLPFGRTAGVCDGNNLQAAGLPTIDTLGVRGGGLHTPTEWIELTSLVERCSLLAMVMMRLTR